MVKIAEKTSLEFHLDGNRAELHMYQYVPAKLKWSSQGKWVWSQPDNEYILTHKDHQTINFVLNNVSTDLAAVTMPPPATEIIS
jgi:hypothetical protein